ncbi:MAG: Polysaccharide biosynthesis protein [candidate division WS6 bacterium OLB20]|uniref:Polysaccharide biosynthesis protein n=1 Tax=candidate division WS6 bacterium OLB20 TaxID=1617426 RepID=A0A136LYT1_9BACT|nr:MAG: Polysaccharide biosynthesis protein [candidate division WS6 bacterium OLB20]
MSKQLLKGTAIFSVAAIVSAALNFVFYTIGKIIGPEEFGKLVALVSLSFIITILQTVVSNLVTKVIAGGKAGDTGLTSNLRPVLFKAQLVVAVFIIAAGWLFLREFLRLDNIIPFIMLALLALTGLDLALYRGILRGYKRFGDMASTQILEAVLKLVTAFAAVLLGLGVSGVMFGLAVSSFITLLLARRMAERIEDKKDYDTDLKKIFSRRLLASVSIGFIVLNLMLTADSIIARNTLTEADAGIYGAVITFGKLIFYLANSITLALFPISSEKGAKLSLLVEGLAMSMFIGIGSFIGFVLLGAPITQFVFGSEFALVPAYLPLEAVIMTMFVCVNQISAYLIGKDRDSYVPLLGIALVIQTGALLFWGNSIEAILTVQTVFMGGMLALSLVYLGYQMLFYEPHHKPVR